ncbi:hypothetical protein GLOIN_2v1628849 [Rhizophagus irregularis DAOM 181602=DAOM 197198]|uniref:Uncharacterized protein n=1 Tax=Rhizophagus irregularis (strain DAOM 181602 / DAOM 197198 / MUCL 43194) TaxID=747089 RepID=U9SVU5_RHIID|nr:hypothetical protein GLOIN_2v1628849 [Rhizophagus irregularis DAOM 181602=DAOM 197198]
MTIGFFSLILPVKSQATAPPLHRELTIAPITKTDVCVWIEGCIENQELKRELITVRNELKHKSAVTFYTDGSCRWGRFHCSGQLMRAYHYVSSTRSELVTIFLVLLSALCASKVTIHTDSQAAIHH